MRNKLYAAALFFLITWPLHAGEVRVSDVVFGTPLGMRSQPAIQRGGDGYLVAWADERTFVPMVFAARLDDAGVPLDRSGFALGETLYDGQARPQIVWNGEAWLVFFSSRRGELLMSRVAPDGTHSEPRVITERSRSDPRGRSIATNGRIIVVTYTVAPNVPGTKILVLSMNGVRISEREVDSHAATTGMVVERDGEFVVAWNNFSAGHGELFAIRLDGSGNFLDESPRLLGKSSMEIEFTGHGNGYLVLEQNWGADRWEFTSHAVSADLATATTPGYVNISDTRRAFVQDGPSAVLIAANGPRFHAFRFDDAGHVSQSDDILQSALPLGDVAMTRTASGFAASWIVLESPYAPRLVAANLDTAFAPMTPPRAVSETAALQTPAAIAAGASEMLVAWLESPGLHLAPFGYNGARLGEDIALGDVNTGYIWPVSMLFDGERYVVAYKRVRSFEQQEIVVRFITPRGELLPDSVSLPAGWETAQVTLARGGASTIVLWRRNEGVVAAAIAGTKLQLQPRVIVSGTVSGQIGAAWNGESFLVAWSEGFLDWDIYLYNKIMGALVDEDLTLRSQPRLWASTPGMYSTLLSLAPHMLAFDGGVNAGLARIDSNGNAGPVKLVPGTLAQLAVDGDSVLMAWIDSQVLRVAPLNADGTLKNEGFRIPGVYGGPVARKGNLTIIGYSRVMAEAGDVRRAFLSLTDDTPNPGRRRSVR